MAKFGLIGHPIAHSKSPALFRAAYGCGTDTYELIETDSIGRALEKFRTEGYTGINVTAPFKDLAMQYAVHPDRISSLLGSTNLLLNTQEGIRAYNTDYYGVKNTLAPFLENPRKLPGPLREKEWRSALVIGAGGAGKAAALALADMGMNVRLANRSAAKAEPYAASIGARYVPLEEIKNQLPQTDLVIYSLACMIPQMEGADLSGKILLEANYARPAFLPKEKENSLLYISGKYWLYNQAIPAFELFTGRKPNTLKMRQIIGIE